MEHWFPLETNNDPYLNPESDQSENVSRIRSGSAASITLRDALYEGLFLYSVML